MKIKSINEVRSISEIIETDSELFPMYERYSKNNWYQLMGESWESINNSFGEIEDLEKAYQDYIKEWRGAVE